MSSSWPALTPDQAKELARFIHSLRRDWDVPGVFSQLGRARDRAPGPELAIAAIRAAMSAHNRTPAVIGMDGEHWRTPAGTSRPRAVDPAELCRVCGHPEPRCRELRERPSDGHRRELPGDDVLVDASTGELAAPVDHSAHRAQLRELMDAALAMPD